MLIQELQKTTQSQLETQLHNLLTQANLPKPLAEAAFYAMANGGKRVRPMLTLATFLTLNGMSKLPQNHSLVQKAMLAVELIHGYSLVHDDLPCMDDDDLRRGKPTCHKVYGEASALLTGDVLQSLAFEILTTDLTENQQQTALFLIQILAPRARRMVAGQQLDLNGENQELSQNQLECIHQDKTGALIEAAVLMGAACASANHEDMHNLQQYARCLGLAFQVQDDVLDVVADTQTLGKTAGADEKLQKSTYVKLLGVDNARKYADSLFYQAKIYIADFGDNNLLAAIVDWLQVRQF